MRSHTSGAMPMGTGAVYSTSKKQKLNTKSSTKAELARVDDVLPQALWTKYFTEAHDHCVTTVLNQDNQSTIKLSKNAKSSSGKGTCHINNQYFLITDRIARKKLAIQALPGRKVRFNTVRPKKWSQTISPSCSKGNSSTISEI